MNRYMKLGVAILILGLGCTILKSCAGILEASNTMKKISAISSGVESGTVKYEDGSLVITPEMLDELTEDHSALEGKLGRIIDKLMILGICCYVGGVAIYLYGIIKKKSDDNI